MVGGDLIGETLEICNAHVIMRNESAGCVHVRGLDRPVYIDSSKCSMPRLSEFGDMEVYEDNDADYILLSFKPQQIGKGVQVRKKVEDPASDDEQAIEDAKEIARLFGRAFCLTIVAANVGPNVENPSLVAMDDAWEELAEKIIDFAVAD